jgi:hypothetical protein
MGERDVTSHQPRFALGRTFLYFTMTVADLADHRGNAYSTRCGVLEVAVVAEEKSSHDI